MYSHDVARKRGMPDAVNGHVGINGFKRSKEMVYGQPGLLSKSKPCTKFFSTTGCHFGEGCHFLHHVPGGHSAAAAQMTATDPGNASLPHIASGPPTPVANKTRLCNKYNTAEGCRFGEKCNFAHGEMELVPPHALAAGGGGRSQPPPILGPAASFGASATAKISVDGSLAGAIIGKGGANTKQIYRSTGAKLFIRDHEKDPNLRNVELEGTFDQIKLATAMVRDLIAAAPSPVKSASGGAGVNFRTKTKLCEGFSKGACAFGDRCNFAHGAAELRK